MKRKLAIVGSEEMTRGQAPWDDLDFEIWVLNEAPQSDWCKRWTASFQMHLPEVYASEYNHVRGDHWDWLQHDHGDRDIWMGQVDSRVPNCRVYPLAEVQAMTPDEMLTSTAAQALALAIHLGYDEIHVYGISIVSNTEYSYQLKGWLYWVGFARGIGYATNREIELVLHSGVEEHFQNRLYGYQGESRLLDKFKERAELLRNELKGQEKRLNRIDQIIADGIMDHRYDVVRQGILDLEQAGIDCGAVAGALGEAEYHLGKGDVFTPRQELERRMAKAQNEGEPLKALMYSAGGKCEYVWNVWKQYGKLEAANQLRYFVKEKRQCAYDCGARLGIYRENLLYMQEYDERITALGGARAIKQMQLQEA